MLWKSRKQSRFPNWRQFCWKDGAEKIIYCMQKPDGHLCPATLASSCLTCIATHGHFAFALPSPPLAPSQPAMATHQRQHALPCGILHAMLCSALFCSHCFIWHSKALDHNSHAQPWFKPSCPGSKPCVHPMHCGVNTWFAPSVGRLGGVDGSRPLPRACQQEPQAVAHLWLQETLDAFFLEVTITKGLRYPCQFKTRGSSRWNLIFPV